MHKQVVSIGEILWDMLPGGKRPGGSSMNVALNLHKQGIDSKFISAVGRDADGRELCSFLERQHFPTELIQQNTLPTSTVQVSLDATGQATYTIVEPVAWDAITVSAALLELVRHADAFVYCSLTCRREKTRQTVQRLLQAASFKVFDINLRPPHFEKATLEDLLNAADLLKVNEEEALYLADSFGLEHKNSDQLLENISLRFDISMICLTLGGEGARVWAGGQIFSHPGYPVQVADTIGAGDAFLATFVASHLQGYPIQTSLDRACRVGAFVASQEGANPDYDQSVFGPAAG